MLSKEGMGRLVLFQHNSAGIWIISHQVVLLGPLYAQRGTLLNKSISVRSIFLTLEVEQDIGRLKEEISSLSKKNFLLENDVRYLDNRIALLISNRMALTDIDGALDDQEYLRPGTIDDKRLRQYSNLFYLLVFEPRHLASLCSLVSMADIDMFLQTVMFTLYGNQYDEGEEHLLLTMFQSVLSTQFKVTSDFSSLLRSNTSISRLMSTFSRRGPGQSYLKRLLAGHIQRVTTLDTDLEINPMKIYERMVAKGQIAEGIPMEKLLVNPLVQEHIKSHVDILLELCNTLLGDIFVCIDHVPYGIRWICKQIRGLARRRDPTVTDSILCSLVGTFFFLRFVNPAIVAPESNLIAATAPQPHIRRTLVLTAKFIQQLVNNPTFSKEAYMEPFKPAIEMHRTAMMQFLHSLCNVPDFYETIEMNQYMALSKRDMKLRISVNELYFLHGLVYKHLDVLAPDPAAPLSQLLQLLGPAPEVLPRKANYVIDLPLYSKWERSITDLNSTLITENNMTQSDILYMEAKTVLVSLLQKLPKAMEEQPINLFALITDGINHERKDIKDLSVQAMRMLRELEETGVIRDETQQAHLIEEVALEFEYKMGAKDKLLDEMACLESVHSTLEQRNTYLRGQLASYKNYLQNVRCVSGSGNYKGDKMLSFVQMENRDRKMSRALGTNPTYKYSLDQFRRDGVILLCEIPEERRQQIFFSIYSPMPGSFLIALHFKGRAEPLVELDIKLDDLLEKQHDYDQALDMEYVRLDAVRLYELLGGLYGLARKR